MTIWPPTATKLPADSKFTPSRDFSISVDEPGGVVRLNATSVWGTNTLATDNEGIGSARSAVRGGLTLPVVEIDEIPALPRPVVRAAARPMFTVEPIGTNRIP